VKRIFIIVATSCFSALVFAQQGFQQTGTVIDSATHKPLEGASISIYTAGGMKGNVTNQEGRFSLAVSSTVDSLKVSMIGYSNKVMTGTKINNPAQLLISLHTNTISLPEVSVKQPSSIEIVKKAIQNTSSMLPGDEYENTSFYREVIQGGKAYFSIAEAIFTTQYEPLKKSYRLRLEKGRSKEDVTATRLFENFHPGGGPDALAKLSFTSGFPSFLDLGKLNLFEYHRDSMTTFNGRSVYVIGFDQREGIHQALDKGSIFIDAGNFSIIRYEAVNSPRGLPYIKSLKGSEKLFAELLQVDLRRKGWSIQADFKHEEGRMVISHAKEIFYIGYKQVKKDLDLDLTITTELAVTGNSWIIKNPIKNGDEWNRKNLVANLPKDFDKDFWGNSNVLPATAEIENIVSSISSENNETRTEAIQDSWQYHQKNTFVTARQNDSIILIPVTKSNWEDDETGGMIFRNVAGNFTIEAAVSLIKRSNAMKIPDKGFQQSGLIIRDPNELSENHVLLSLGTGGNANSKYFLRKTENGRSKGTVEKIDSPRGLMKLERKGNTITAFFRKDSLARWQKINSYQMNLKADSLEVGMMVMARFAGNGPNMKPDMKAIFTGFSIKKEDP
jgi:CarboxypepD_reg-like domain